MQYNTHFIADCPDYPLLETVLPAAKRIIAIGDIHGDYNVAVRCLIMANVIDEQLEWIGDDTIVVQVGDQIDSCRPIEPLTCQEMDLKNDTPDDLKVLNFFTKLHNKAIKYNGGVYSLLGNHELMNVYGDMRYVSKANIEMFNNYKDNFKSIKDGYEARQYLFKPGNKIARELACTRVAILIVGNILFVHAGLVNNSLNNFNIKSRNDLAKLNEHMRKWLLGISKNDYVNKLINDRSSFFWTRALGNLSSDDSECDKYLGNVMNVLKLDNMIIGHTPQAFLNNNNINSTCNGIVWRIDNGISKAFDVFNLDNSKSRIQVLEILDGKTFNIIFD